MGEAHRRKFLDAANSACHRIFYGKIHSAKGSLLDRVVVASQRVAMPFDVIERFLHVCRPDPIADIASVRILGDHAQGFVRTCATHHDARMWA